MLLDCFLDGRAQTFSFHFEHVSVSMRVCICVQGENGEEVHSEELVMPGSLREMAEFEQHAISLTRCSVTCTLPSVNIHLPSKGFLETLYNRFGTGSSL